MTKRMMARKQAREINDDVLKTVSGGMNSLSESSGTGTQCYMHPNGQVCCADFVG